MPQANSPSTSFRFGVFEIDLRTGELTKRGVRLRLIKIAARVIEMASRVRLAFAAACPEAELFASLPAVLMPSGP